ncbi:GntR family transcriptional regulator [uncultured Pelagimonas sp.]|uniref:GntR family transcriptional regulator n=1 Tax=uncultured Pelagimonas sp. TaxID=1618102 RepID=UPI00262C89B2|nr:GntR family transcriptional regulator [uncultured Pelagimonas sp.]
MNIIDDRGQKETSATRSAYLSIREMILTGKLPAGEKLKIEKLRTLLETGASPVREALSLLTSDMLVERIDQRGFRAAPASQANFAEILMLRCALEDMAVRQSVDNADSDWEEALVLCHHRMKKAADNGDGTFEDTHKAFHMALLDNCGSPMLLKYCSQLYDLNIRYRYLAAGSDSYQSRNIPAEHEDIMSAAIQRDAALAAERLITHYRLTGDYLNAQLKDI